MDYCLSTHGTDGPAFRDGIHDSPIIPRNLLLSEQPGNSGKTSLLQKIRSLSRHQTNPQVRSSASSKNSRQQVAYISYGGIQYPPPLTSSSPPPELTNADLNDDKNDVFFGNTANPKPSEELKKNKLKTFWKKMQPFKNAPQKDEDSSSANENAEKSMTKGDFQIPITVIIEPDGDKDSK